MLTFRPLLTLRTTHSYYVDGAPCLDLEIAATSETARLLRGARLTTKTAAGVLHVLYEADGDGARRVSAAGRTLRFAVGLREPYFPNFTDLPPGSAGKLLCYDNAAAAKKLGAVTPRIAVGAVLVHPWSSTARPAVARLQDTLRRTWLEQDAGPRPEVYFELAGLEPGAYTLVEEYPGGDVRSTKYYHHAGARQAFAMIDITVADSFYAAPPAFELAFAARREPLTYYFVFRNYQLKEEDELVVVDRGAEVDHRDAIAFARLSPTAIAKDPVGARLAAKDVQIVAFRSAAPVARRSAARRKLQLHRNSEVIVEHLPQPGPDKPEASVIIHLSK